MAQTRECIAQEAAKIMYEQNMRDYQRAKQKACERLRLSGRVPMPANDEIQSALNTYLRLYKSDTHPDLIRQLRLSAADSMRFLSEFEPRLVGSVLHGTADEHAPVQLHVFADPPESILKFLLEHSVRYQLANRRIQYCDGRAENATLCECVADEVTTELILFSRKGLREAPKSPIDGKPMRRMNLRELKELMSEELPVSAS